MASLSYPTNWHCVFCIQFGVRLRQPSSIFRPGQTWDIQMGSKGGRSWAPNRQKKLARVTKVAGHKSMIFCLKRTLITVWPFWPNRDPRGSEFKLCQLMFGNRCDDDQFRNLYLSMANCEVHILYLSTSATAFWVLSFKSISENVCGPLAAGCLTGWMCLFPSDGNSNQLKQNFNNVKVQKVPLNVAMPSSFQSHNNIAKMFSVAWLLCVRAENEDWQLNVFSRL